MVSGLLYVVTCQSMQQDLQMSRASLLRDHLHQMWCIGSLHIGKMLSPDNIL